mmetsp:Transcript_44127/g.127637  ORF Transcript_44127/g.127637 Transcript_44127/m.127637 type:complete len:308 (+) Transcript_44127:1070-1993(+)
MATAISGGAQTHASGLEDVIEEVPLDLLQEGGPLSQLLLAPLRALGGLRKRLPVVADAKGEGLGAVRVQPHEPVDCEQGTKGPLVLVVPGAAAGHSPRIVLVDGQVERELGEGRAAVLKELPAGVVLVPYPPRGVPGPCPVGLPAAHQLLQQPARALRGHRRLVHRRLREPALGVRPAVRGLGLWSQLVAKDLLLGLPGVVGHHNVAALVAGEGKVLSLSQAPHREAPALDLVNAVDSLQAWVRAGVLDLLQDPVGVHVHQDLLQRAHVQPQPLRQRLPQRVLPGLAQGHAHGDGPVLDLDGPFSLL